MKNMTRSHGGFDSITASERQFVRALHKRSARQAEQCFLAEGLKLCNELIFSSFEPTFIVLDAAASPDEYDLAVAFAKKGTNVVVADSRHFVQMSDTKSPQGILAVIALPTPKKSYSSKKIIALDGVADPGNVGSIIRAADWFGFQDIVLGPGSADAFSPKTVRSSMGSVFRVQVQSEQNLSEFFDRHDSHALAGAVLNPAAQPLESVSLPHPYIVIFGNESIGISVETKQRLTHPFFIRGFGQGESLNVAVAAGITLYGLAEKNV